MKRGSSIPPSVQTWLLLKLPGNRKYRPNLTAITQNTAENSKEWAGMKGESTGALVCACLHQNLPNQKLNCQDSSPSPGLHRRSQECKWRMVKDREGKPLGTWGGHETLEKTEILKF